MASIQMEDRSLKERFKLKELELNSLLEITQAINNNLSEDALYKIYNFTLRANLNINKLALYVLDEDWECQVNFGTDKDFFSIPFHQKFLEINEISTIDSKCAVGDFLEFDTVIPVSHKDKLLATVFASGLLTFQGDTHTRTDTAFLQAITNLIIVAIENKKLARRELRQEAFRKELEIAKDVQKFLFPDDLPYGVRLKVEASYLPSRTVGGDYYDYIPINKNQFLLCIADVSGKGIPAAIIMSNFQAALRTLIRQTPNLSEIIKELNFQILENAKGENFITVFAAIYDHQLKTLVYVNAGHNPPVLIDGKKDLKILTDGTTVLGVFHPLPFINEGFITELDNFLYFSYTDGLSETFNPEGQEFGADRINKYLMNNADQDLKQIHKGILDEVYRFKGNASYTDDITILSCRVDS